MYQISETLNLFRKYIIKKKIAYFRDQEFKTFFKKR